MNKISASITQIIAQDSCAMIQMQCSFGRLYAAMVHTDEFAIDDKVIATFRENEVFVMPKMPKMPAIPNMFDGRIHSFTQNGIFTHLSLMPLLNDTSYDEIYALLPAPYPLMPKQECLWYVPCSAILLEKDIKWIS